MFYELNHIALPGYLKIERGRNFSFPPHLHQCFEIILLLSGKMHITINDKTFELSEKEALLVFPNQIHSLHSIESKHILCVFSPDLVHEYAVRLAGKIPQDNLFVPDLFSPCQHKLWRADTMHLSFTTISSVLGKVLT